MNNNEALKDYRSKRDFSRTSEPDAQKSGADSGDFMVHHHDASREHYDLRLQWKGVLKSWAIPKGPSYSSQVKRLAVQTEDHPDDYKAFEGVIPDGEYGAGPSLIWDAGEFHPLGDFDKGFKKGHLRFELDGVKLKGAWSLIRIKSDDKKAQWLLIKEKDEFARDDTDSEILEAASVASGRTLDDLRNEVMEPKKKVPPTPKALSPS